MAGLESLPPRLEVKPMQTVRGAMVKGNKRPRAISVSFTKANLAEVMTDEKSKRQFEEWLYREVYNALEFRSSTQYSPD